MLIKFLKGIILIVAVLTLSLHTYDYARGIYNEYLEELEGTASTEGRDVEVTVEKGDSATKIAKMLKKKGLIKFPMAFTNRYKETDFRIQPGTYILNTGMSTLQMIETMSPVAEVIEPIMKLTIPEGFTVEMIAKRCEANDICTAQEFLNAVESVTATNFPFIEGVSVNAKYKLQGYLFPATYDIYEDTTAQELVQDMLDAFEYYYSAELRAVAESKGMSTQGVIIRASIIEREARLDEERATIAGVIENRLEAGMPLQMCPTVLYPLTDGLYDKPQVLYEDLEIDSPYNTYLYPGLPAGPICNPGLASIKAALAPEEHNYLYYHVGDPETGAHIFTETYEEHVDTQIIGGPTGIPEDTQDLDGDGILDYVPSTEEE